MIELIKGSAFSKCNARNILTLTPLSRLHRNTCRPSAAVAACVHDAGSGSAESHCWEVQREEGERARKKERLVCHGSPWDRYSLCPRLLLRVQRMGEDGERENPSSLIYVISTNFSDRGGRGQVALAVV